MLWAILATVLVVSSAAEEREPSAWLLGSKSAKSSYAVENLDYVIEYGLYNVGDRPATKVTLDDRNSFSSQYFDVVKGLLSVRFERIPPGENITHVVVLRPRQYGLFNYTAAQITYRPDENSNDIRIGLTTSPGDGYVYRQKEYERRFAPKYLYWLTFFLIIAPGTLGAFYLFNASKNRYESFVDKKKAA